MIVTRLLTKTQPKEPCRLTFAWRELIAWIIVFIMVGSATALVFQVREQSKLLHELVYSFDNMYTNTVITIKK